MADQLDQWDIVSSVGLTALGVAAARAIETHHHDGLVRDPYAEHFVRAAQPPVPMPTGPGPDGDGELDAVWQHSAGYMGLRSKFFDDYFAAATAAGVDQVVLLAAGLDARAFRLAWAPVCDLYEVDQPKVLQFKQEVLDDLGAEPACRRHPVGTDLRDDWVTALTDAGFAPERPTAWLAEGLLPYLPGAAEEALFDTVHKLSAPGSRLAVEQTGPHNAEAMRTHPMFLSAAEKFGVDIGSLWNTDPRRDPVEWLRSAGWQVTTESATDAGRRYGRPLPEELADAMGRGCLITARLEDRAPQAPGTP
jgi:methyltransferase (TIGR00027 family)